MSSVPIVFDIGGTKLRVAAVRGGELDEIHVVDTPQEPGEGLETLARLARESSQGDTISELVGDFSGVYQGTVVCKFPNLPKWDKTDIGVRLQSLLNAPTTLFNDAELVALGEYFYGYPAAYHSKAMAYITVSTGVGGALIVDGQVDRDGKYNYEIGHQLVRGKELEAQVSGTAVKTKYGVEPKDFNNPEALHEMAEILAEGIYNTVLAWSPDTIVLGGSMIVGESNTIPVDRVENRLNELVTTIYPHAPRIEKAKLSKLGGLYGGMAFLNERE